MKKYPITYFERREEKMIRIVSLFQKKRKKRENLGFSDFTL